MDYLRVVHRLCYDFNKYYQYLAQIRLQQVMHTPTPYTTGTINMNPDLKTKWFEVEALHSLLLNLNSEIQN